MAAATMSSGINEEDIIVFDPPTPEKTYQPPPAVAASKLSNVFHVDASSSDSDSEDEPVVKKKRATRTIRNVAEDVEDTPDCAVYTAHVKDIFQNARPPIAMESDPDDVEDNHEILPTKKKRGQGLRQRQTKKKEHVASPIEDLISSDDDDILIMENESPSLERGRDRSPTPPPSEMDVMRRRTRTSKGCKQAIGQLTGIRGRLMMGKLASACEGVLEDRAVVESPEKRGLTVKIRTVHGVERIDMKPNDNFEGVIRLMSQKLNAEMDKIIIYHGDYAVEPFDTPKCLALTVADILDCHIVTSKEGVDDSDLNDSLLAEVDDPTMIHLRIQSQSQNKRHDPAKIKIKRKMPLEKLMRQYAKKMGESYEKLTFYFDGTVVRKSDTADSLDMEDDDCLDVTKA